MSEYNKRVGAEIRRLRKQKNISQIDLCKSDSYLGRICDRRTLIRVENGETAATPAILNKLLAALRVSPLEFAYMVDGQEMIDFQHDFSEIWEMWFNRQHEEATRLLDILKTKPYCDITNPKVKQATLLFDALELVDVKKDIIGCLNVLHKAINITSSCIFEENEIDFGFISNHIFTLNEYRILKLLAIVKTRLGEPEASIFLLTAMCESLCNKKVDVEVRNRLLSNVYYTLSEELINTGQYQDALSFCEKGLLFCKQINNYKVLPFLLYNEAKALFFLNDMVHAEEKFKQSYNAFLALGNEESALRTKEWAAEKYQILI